MWIQTVDDPTSYVLRVTHRGEVPFVPTEVGAHELRTAIAPVDGLLPDRTYRYDILKRGHRVPGSQGSVRTMPDPDSSAEVTFLAVSCNHHGEEGIWARLAATVREQRPRFLVMLGDNVYLDKDPNLWKEHVESPSSRRRAAMADQYRTSWSRPHVKEVLANVPTYMIWDDHDIRDGWGSFAPDSPTLAQRFDRPGSQRIFRKYERYFEDARHLYWHFQMAHNPPHSADLVSPGSPVASTPETGRAPTVGVRSAMPMTFRCGRTAVVLVDARGDRDLWREEDPVLGARQWDFLDQFVDALDPSVDAVVIVTTVPIVGMSATGQAQFVLGTRTDDVELFRTGDEDGLWALQDTSGEKTQILLAAAGSYVGSKIGSNPGWGSYKLSDIDDIRDQWSHEYSRPEQVALLRYAARIAHANRRADSPRRVLFVGGDWHAGGTFDIEIADHDGTVPCLVTSGVSQRADDSEPLLHTLADESMEVGPGISATMRTLVADYNFGSVTIVPTGGTPAVTPALVHEGTSTTFGYRISLRLP